MGPAFFIYMQFDNHALKENIFEYLFIVIYSAGTK